MPDPTYAELLAQRQQEWGAAQREAARQVEESRERLRRMPDVYAPESPWTPMGITCACGGGSYEVMRWVTVNGDKYRTELRCLTCQTVGTWDFGDRRWLG